MFISVTAWRVCCGLKGYFTPSQNVSPLPLSIKPGIRGDIEVVSVHAQYTEDENMNDELNKMGGY